MFHSRRFPLATGKRIRLGLTRLGLGEAAVAAATVNATSFNLDGVDNAAKTSNCFCLWCARGRRRCRHLYLFLAAITIVYCTVHTYTSLCAEPRGIMSP
jgi:hypothetical protein